MFAFIKGDEMVLLSLCEYAVPGKEISSSTRFYFAFMDRNIKIVGFFSLITTYF